MNTTHEIQAALNARGYDSGTDGKRGTKLKQALRAFQRDAGLTVSGIADPITRAALTYPDLGPDAQPEPEAATFHLSDKGLLALAIREGVVLQSYRDESGVWMIGIKHLATDGEPKPVKGLTITLAKAVSLFRRDVARHEDAVREAITVPLKVWELDALISFEASTGGIKRAALTRAINDGNGTTRPVLITEGFRSWLKPPGVEERRMAECRQFLTGDYGDLSRIAVHEGSNGWNRPDVKSLRSVSTVGLLR